MNPHFIKMFGQTKKLINGKEKIQVIGVMDNPPFSYTVGLLANFKFPEIITIGISATAAQNILNKLCEMLGADEKFECFKLYENLIQGGYPVEFRPVHKTNLDAGEWLNYAESYYHRYPADTSFTAWQMFWSDINFKMPWDQEYSLSPIYQPRLDVPDYQTESVELGLNP